MKIASKDRREKVIVLIFKPTQIHAVLKVTFRAGLYIIGPVLVRRN